MFTRHAALGGEDRKMTFFKAAQLYICIFKSI